MRNAYGTCVGISFKIEFFQSEKKSTRLMNMKLMYSPCMYEYENIFINARK